MRTLSKAQRYRKLALKETNKAMIGLFHRLADEAERREATRREPVGPAMVVSMAAWLAKRARPIGFVGAKAS